MITLEEVKHSTGIDDLAADACGKVRFAPGLSLSAKKKYLKIVHTVYRRKDIGWRFLIGSMVNDLRLSYGVKKSYCQQAFGEKAGLTVYSYSRTAAQWDEERQDFDWSWTYYKEAGLLPSDLKHKLMGYHSAGLWSLEKHKEFCSKWREENKARSSRGTSCEIKTGQNQTSSPLVSTSITNRELVQILQAVRNAPTRRDAVALRNAAISRIAELDDDDEFAAEEQEERKAA